MFELVTLETFHHHHHYDLRFVSLKLLKNNKNWKNEKSKNETVGGARENTIASRKKMKNAFPIHRSAVYAKHGMVAASQPYAVNAGLKILREGGNAIDAAIATAASLAVTEPCSTGLGGDCFLLFYEAKTKKVHALNGSGRSSSSLTLEKLKRDLKNTMDPTHAHFVTVPGTAKGWEDAILKWGTKSFYDVLHPAIEIAKNGFPVSPITSFHWNRGVSKIMAQNDAKRAQDLLSSDTTKGTTPRGPNPGEIFQNPHMAQVLTSLGKKWSFENIL